MAFNSDTYKANKWRKTAYASLAHARALKARIAAGEAYDWELDRVAIHVRDALSENRLAIFYRTISPRIRQ